MIPKLEKVKIMEELWPISLSNSVHKLIARIMDNIIRGILSKAMTLEHLSFLNGRQIHDVICIYQAVL